MSPLLTYLEGVRVFMNPDEHNPPHLHAQYGEEEALIALNTGEVLKGSLPSGKEKAVKQWLAHNREACLAVWKRLNPNLRSSSDA